MVCLQHTCLPRGSAAAALPRAPHAAQWRTPRAGTASRARSSGVFDGTRRCPHCRVCACAGVCDRMDRACAYVPGLLEQGGSGPGKCSAHLLAEAPRAEAPPALPALRLELRSPPSGTNPRADLTHVTREGLEPYLPGVALHDIPPPCLAIKGVVHCSSRAKQGRLWCNEAC